MLFSIIGSLESLLSAKAVEQIDPGAGRPTTTATCWRSASATRAALVGGLPMISEIVRSKANIDNGAQTRFANLFHGVFLLLFVALVPVDPSDPAGGTGGHAGVHGVPPGVPAAFAHMYHVGREQLVSPWRRSSACWPPIC